MSVDLNLAIVGGGPAGLTTALFLQHLAPDVARRTVVFEKARYPREKICAGAVGGRALALLDSIGVRPEVPRVSVRGLAVTTRAGRLVQRCDDEVGWVVRRVELDAALAEIARSRGVTIEDGCGVEAVRATERGPVELVLAGGRVVRANAIVGADGVGGVVRRSFGWSRGTIVAQVVEVDTPRTGSDLPNDVLHFDLTEPALRGYAWDFPTPLDGAVHVSRGVYDLGPRTLDPAIRLRSRSDATPLGKERRFSERGITLGEPLARPRVLLAGEAAGIDPVLGEGIAQAIFYGAAAGRYLAKKLSIESFGFEDYAPLALTNRLGVDLVARARALPFVYGGTRAVLERFVTRSPALARIGLDYFGGSRVSRVDLARAGGDLLRSALVTAATRS